MIYLCVEFRMNLRMKKYILISILALFAIFSFSLSAQEVKPKAVVENERPAVEITVSANRVSIQNAIVGQKLEVFSVVGLKVDESIIKSSTAEYVLNVPKGYYILKIGDTVKKVAIK